MTGDVGVVGAGIVGLAVARELARAGRRVVVYERDEPGLQASWAAAGMLAPQVEAHAPGPFLDLLLAARERFPTLVEDLERETRLSVGYRTDGMLAVALDEAESEALAERYRWQREAGLTIEHIGGREARTLEPALSEDVLDALFFPGDHQIDNRLLTRALHLSASGAGAEVRTGTIVLAIEPSNAGVRLVLHDGTARDFSHIVLAAGSWSGTIDGLPRRIPVKPVHGQLLATGSSPPPFQRTVMAPGVYLVPRADGRLILGATAEEVGFRRAETPAGMHALTGAAMRVAPVTANHPIVGYWSGFRPGTPDGLPILGPDPEAPRLVYATGHFRNGILLAPITGMLVTALVRGDDTGIDLSPYSVTRFIQ